ncbi:hypothetical protein [Streptomyces candidus]|uniref:Uncharacterized protein n=1 Tax=Streptomyces candidus TaxID=67283 RepID=A0A7X0HMI9_9ACTN|nr:hypothetical protein [Streptomyces candidus]MBB6440193.1 hypothetical protein [Streptomyces candidus]
MPPSQTGGQPVTKGGLPGGEPRPTDFGAQELRRRERGARQ